MSLYRPVRVGPWSTAGNLFQAPVAGYSDRSFRSICVEQGADLTCTELISAEALVRDSAKTLAMLRRADNEVRFAIQLFGNEPDQLERAAVLLAPFRPDAVDLNCGCPVPKVVKTGAGSALMRDPVKLAACVAGLVRASDRALGGVPVTVKIRLGWDDSSLNYREVARAAVDSGAALVGLHARTRAQGYGGKAAWERIGELAASLEVPVIGSGDLFKPEDAERMLRTTGCAGVMFARGAMGNPFIFSEARDLLTTGAYRAPSAEERVAAGFRQLKLAVADWGEPAACREMRKQFCAYSKGVPGGAAVRDRLVRASTVAEYRSALIAAGLLAGGAGSA